MLLDGPDFADFGIVRLRLNWRNTFAVLPPAHIISGGSAANRYGRHPLLLGRDANEYADDQTRHTASDCSPCVACRICLTFFFSFVYFQTRRREGHSNFDLSHLAKRLATQWRTHGRHPASIHLPIPPHYPVSISYSRASLIPTKTMPQMTLVPWYFGL